MRNPAPRHFTVALMLLALAACSTDSPTAPERTPAPPPGSSPGTAWNITVTAQPNNLAQNASQPATITVQVRRASDGAVPANGTTMVVSAGLGVFSTADSGVRSVVVSLGGGAAQLLYFAGAILGQDTIQAQLESSVGQAFLQIVEPLVEVVANFSNVTPDPDNNLTIQFVNDSTGDPTQFSWNFGDGGTSSAENPQHTYAGGGTYVVQLTASKTGSSDTITKTVTVQDNPEPPLFITEVTPNFGPAAGGTTVTIKGTGFTNPLRVLFGGKLGDVNRVRSGSITVVSPPGDIATVPCDSGGGAGSGSRQVDTSVSLTVQLQSGTTETAPGGFTYIVSPSPAPCL